jgi:hypothetical protein
MIVIPILLSFPAMFFSVPPLMVFLPTPLAFSVQIATPVFGLATTLTVVLDGLIQSCLCLLDGMLALWPVIRVNSRGCYKKHKRRPHYGRGCGFSKS